MENSQTKKILITCSFATLFIGSYLDSVRGPLIPELTEILNLDYSQTSLFLVFGNIAAIAVAFLLNPILNRWNEKKVLSAICCLALATAMLSTQIRSYSGLLTLAIFWGSTVCALGSICNVLLISGTDPKIRSRYLCALHTMYGVASLAAPALAAGLLKKHFGWQSTILVTMPFLAALLIYVKVSLPQTVTYAPQKESKNINVPQSVALVTVALYVGAEVVTSMWMVTYLVKFRHLTLSQAAPYAAGFFAVMTVTRILSFFWVRPSQENKILMGTLFLFAVFFALGHRGYLWAFSLTGVLGPWYPLILSKTSRDFPLQARSLTVWILTVGQVSLAISHATMGKLTDLVGISVSYRVPLVMIAAVIGFLTLYLKLSRNFSLKPEPVAARNKFL